LHPGVPILILRESMEEVVIEGYRIPSKTRFLGNRKELSKLGRSKCI